jgi:hypothetical protein
MSPAMGLTLGNPWGALALLAVPVLVGAYFLRKRQPPRVVSALFLWRHRDLQAEAGPRLERFSRETSLALEALAVCCATLFLADVRCGAATQRPHLVVVVDGSLSMAAVVDGRSMADRVRSEVAALLQAKGVGTLTVIESGPEPTLLAGPQAEVNRGLAALERWTPVRGGHDVGPALAMARDLTPGLVSFFTDGPLPAGEALPPRVEAHSVGRPLDNVAFLSAQRVDEGGVARLTVRVGNFSVRSVAVPVRFELADGASQSSPVMLEPGGTAVARVALKTVGAVTASLPPDALAIDGRVTLLPSPLAQVTVGFLPGLAPAAEQAIRRFTSVAPGVRVGEPAGLTVGPSGSQARLTIGIAGAPVAFLGPFFAEKAHPLFDDVQLGGVVWSAGRTSPPGRPLMSMGEVVLVSEEDDGALHFNLDLGKSNLTRTVAWPVLIGNVARLARRSSPGFPRHHVTLDEDVPVVTRAQGRWALKGPEGVERPLLGAGPTVVPRGLAPGRWELLEDGEPVDAMEVMAIDPAESDLRSRGPWREAQAPIELASASVGASRSSWPVALMLGLVLLDFWLTARAKRRVGP